MQWPSSLHAGLKRGWSARVKPLILRLLRRTPPRACQPDWDLRALFSEGFYRDCYHDIPLTISAFLHFVNHGIEEGRSPNPYLSLDFIRRRYPWLGALSNRQLLRGDQLDKMELSANFDSLYYRELYADLLRGFSGSALAHYLASGYSRGLRTSPGTLVVPHWLCRLIGREAAAGRVEDCRCDTALRRRILIAIPAYKDEAKTRACIDSLYRQPLPEGVRVLVINDCSPEQGLGQYLGAASRQFGFELIVNSTNLGFTGSVNLANEYRLPDEDLLLLNTDTLVPSGMIARLAAHLDRDSQVATVTPLSNNATIATLPCIGEDLQFFTAQDVDRLDWAAWRITQEAELLVLPLTVPTAVGFCMLISHQAIPAGPLFDVSLFGKGYGEENYFCLKATEAGFTHVIAPDVFVWHHGGASFGEEKWQQIKQAGLILDQNFPDYRSSVSQFCHQDPLLMHRLAVSLLAMAGGSYAGCLVITHQLGGGIDRYLNDRIRQLCPGEFLLILRPSDVRSLCDIEFVYQSFAIRLAIDVGEPEGAAAALVDLFPLQRVEIHSIIGHDSALLYHWIKELSLPFTTVLHDYTAACPRVQPRDERELFCGLPDPQTCNRCIERNCDRSRMKDDIATWRYRHQWLLYGANQLIAPSISTAEAYRHLYPGLAIDVQPHEDQDAILWQRICSRLRIQQQPQLASSQRLVVLGSLAAHKGLHLLEEIAELLRDQSLELVVIGPVCQPSPLASHGNVFVYGEYDDEDLPGLIEQFQPGVIFFPARWPETYSYTLSDALRSGYPVLAPAVGAFPERLEGMPDCQLYRFSDTPQQIVALLRHQLALTSPWSGSIPVTGPASSPAQVRGGFPI